MKRRIGIAMCIGVALAAAACNWGTRPDNFPLAQGPQGAQATLRVRGESFDRVGELFAVDTGGVALRNEDDHRILRVRWNRVYTLVVAGAPSEDEIHAGETVSAEKRGRLALFSRFPQGIGNLPITIDSLISQARTSTTRYADRRVAVADGYRRVGADFPGMGEHWINPSLLLSRRIEPSRPAILTYASINGRPTLLGVGYMLVVRGDSVPPDVPGWPNKWHEHSGLLADESVARHRPSEPTNETHVWVMHAWTVLENPDGAFSPDNWALPYLRAGLPTPAEIDPGASRALSLTIDGGAFLRGALVDAGLRSDANARSIDSAIAKARRRAIAATRNQATVNTELRDVWTELASEIERSAGPGARALLAPSHEGIHR